jgi:polysaccharide biosynthesis transport protein
MTIVDSGGTAATNAEQAAPSQLAPIILRVFETARRHILLIAVIVTTALVAALILTLLATPLYTAVTRVEISRQQANVTNVESLQSEDFAQSGEFYATQHALLGARSLAERVAGRLRLARNENFLTTHGLSEGGVMDGLSARPTRDELRQREAAVVNALISRVRVLPLRGSALVDVDYTSPDPALSAEIANAWVQEFVRQSMDRRLGLSADARSYLETRLAALRQRVEQSERELVNYAREQGIVRLTEERSADGSTTTTQTLVSADIEVLNTQLAEATAQRIAAEGRRDAARTRRSSDAMLSSPALATMRQQRAELAARYAQLLQRFEPQFPEARAVERQLASLDASIATEERRVMGAVDANYDAAVRHERGLRARVDGLLGQLDQENRASIQYNIFQREVDTNRGLYQAMLQRYREIGVAGVGTNNISVIDEARAPGGPSSPNLPMNLAIALILGLAAAAAVVFVIENLDEAIRRPQQVTEQLGVPLLGAVPEDDVDEPLDDVADPKSMLSESYMSVRTNLGFTTDHGAPRSLSITSTLPAEGKSTTSVAIAAMLGRTGKRVILLDLDLRRPSLAKRLGLRSDRGISNYLSGDDAWSDMVQETRFANLSFIAAGPIPPSAPELLTTDRLQHLVRELSATYDHVLIDCPPVLALSDAQLITKAVEGVVFVVESGRTPIRAVANSINAFRNHDIRLFGVVLTKYRAQLSSYGYGYNYENQYNYGKTS